jgi:hypothetical protein
MGMKRSPGMLLIGPRGNLRDAIPEMIEEFRRGSFSQSRIAKMAGIDPGTLRIAIRNGERAKAGPLHDLSLAEMSSRGKRPWSSKSGSGKPFPKPSAEVLARRAAAARRWAELFDLRTVDDDERDSVVAKSYADDPSEASNRSGGEANSSNSGSGIPPVGEPGRPRTLNQKLVDGIAITIRYGSSRSDTATGFGLHPRTLPKWLARGKREPDTIYGLLWTQVSEARCNRRKAASLVAISSR